MWKDTVTARVRERECVRERGVCVCVMGVGGCKEV